MKLRIFLYKPDALLLESLPQFLRDLGHDLAVIDLPQTCLQYDVPENRCVSKQICADTVIVGPGASPAEGLSILERRYVAGCQGVLNSAIVCDGLSADERRRANAIGCQCFIAPVPMATIGAWLTQIEKTINPVRELSSFTIGSTVA